jgi:hypothetical protein
MLYLGSLLHVEVITVAYLYYWLVFLHVHRKYLELAMFFKLSYHQGFEQLQKMENKIQMNIY